MFRPLPWVVLLLALASGAAAQDDISPPTDITVDAGDRAVRIGWRAPEGATGIRVYRVEGGEAEQVTSAAVRDDHWFDLGVTNGTTVRYVLRATGTSAGFPVLGAPSDTVAATPTADQPDLYIEATARRAFDYTWNEANPANGLVKDRSRPDWFASVAAVGFGLSAITVGVDRGWITRAEGVERTLATLDFFAACPQGNASSGVCGYRGFFYHFLTLDTGVRQGTTELSTIDTALLIAGMLHAAQYYDGGGDEARIRELADQIWRRVEWDWAANRPPLVALGWKPEEGFAICNGGLCDWRGYNEAMILYLLGLGSPTHPLPDGAWDAWTASYEPQWQEHYGYEFLTFPPLFGHQYSHIWVDFRGMPDAYMRGKGIDYFENSRRATLANRAYAIAVGNNAPGLPDFPNYSADEWGLTASDDPFGYAAHGAPPAQSDNGTITPTAAGGSYAFTPELSRGALRTFYARYYASLWGPYGLRDAYNIREGWFATDYLGIDQAPILLMIENERTGAIWDAFMAHPDVRAGLVRAGFEPRAVPTESAPPSASVVLQPPTPNPSAGTVRLAFSLAEGGAVRLRVFDALGRTVAVLCDGPAAAGSHAATWDASGVAPGVYIVRLEANGAAHSRTFSILR